MVNSFSKYRATNQLALVFRPTFDTTAETMILLATAVCFGLVPLFARSLQEIGTGSATISFYRFGFGALVLLPCLPLTREKRNKAFLLGVSGLLMGLSWIGYLESIKVASIAAAGIIYMSYPAFTMLFAWLLVGQRPTLRGLIAALMILAAASFNFSPNSVSPAGLVTLLWALPAPIAFGFLIVVVSCCIRRLGVPERMACISLGATLGLAPLALGSCTRPLFFGEPEHWFAIGGIALFTALVPQLLYVYAAPRVGPSRSAAAGSFELPTMIIVGWLAFGELVGWREMLAAGLIIAAVLVAPVIRTSNN